MKTFTNLSTQAKLLVSFGLVLFMMILANIIAYRGIREISQSEKELHDNHFMVAININILRSYQNHNRTSILEMMLSRDKNEMIRLEKSINDRADSVKQIVNALLQLDNDPSFKNKLILLEETLDQYRIGRNEEISLIKEGRVEEARLLGTGLQGERFNKIRTLSHEMSDMAQAAADQQLAVDMQESQTSIFLFLGFGALAFLLGIVIVYVMNRTIALPLNELTRMTSKIASGDLKVEIQSTQRKDEIGLLSQAFTQMVNSLQQFVGEINEGVNTLASSSTQILAATTQVATGTAETATAISETSTTVEEVQQASKQSAQKAKNVADNAQRLAQVSQNGQKAVEETIKGINNIKEQMESIAQTVIRLSEQSQSIGGIIASVTDIADQSNLLAVNAAIEASKAGEHGKGFGVVAQEIKNLAGQSKQATLQVRNILNDVQKATGAAVMATEQGSKAVESGLMQSKQAGESIKTLAESSNEAVQAATQIVASSQQQVVGMDQIGVAMQNINQAGTETAVSMVQAEKSAKNLHELGQKLKELVKQYTL